MSSFHLRDNHQLKRSFLAECPQNQTQPVRNSLLKRSSLVSTPLGSGDYQHPPFFELPKTPKPANQSSTSSNGNSQLVMNPRQ